MYVSCILLVLIAERKYLDSDREDHDVVLVVDQGPLEQPFPYIYNAPLTRPSTCRLP